MDIQRPKEMLKVGHCEADMATFHSTARLYLGPHICVSTSDTHSDIAMSVRYSDHGIAARRVHIHCSDL